MKRIVVLTAAFVALGLTGTATAAQVRGVVVGSEHGTVLVARSGGVVQAVRGHAMVGTRVVVRAGTIHRVGHARRTQVRGIVVRNAGSLTFLSAAHRMLVVHRDRALASARDTAPTAPAPGSVVTSTVTIDDDGDLELEDEDEIGNADAVQIQAPVTAVAPGSVTVTVNGRPLTLKLPAGLTLPASVVGTTVTLTLRFDDDKVVADDDDEHDDDGGHDDHHGGHGHG